MFSIEFNDFSKLKFCSMTASIMICSGVESPSTFLSSSKHEFRRTEIHSQAREATTHEIYIINYTQTSVNKTATLHFMLFCYLLLLGRAVASQSWTSLSSRRSPTCAPLHLPLESRPPRQSRMTGFAVDSDRRETVILQVTRES